MREVIASAPGKVNLVLRSGRKDEFGYHPLTSVFEAVDLREWVQVRTWPSAGIHVKTLGYTPASVSGRDPVYSSSLTQRLSELDTGDHLAVKAARLLQPLAAVGKWGSDSRGLHITVHKTIPAAGGMAGGSADAAATLVAVNQLWELGLDGTQVEQLGRRLGADVPACLMGGTSLGTGRGDHMQTVPGDPARHWWALAFSEEGLSTPAVFAEFDRQVEGLSAFPALPEPMMLTEAERFLASATDIAPLLENQLAPAALTLRPELRELGAVAKRAGATAWMVSGSGPTIAALVDSADAAATIARQWEGCPSLIGTAVTGGPSESAIVEENLPKWTRRESK